MSSLSSAPAHSTISSFTPIHTRQAFGWDCGLACVFSVCRGLGIPVDEDAILEALPSTSLWTIDLVKLLHELEVPCAFYTKCLGVDPSHATLSFYAASFSADAERVKMSLAIASAGKIPMHESHVSIDDICEALSQKTKVYIMLVDVHHLKCTKCWSARGLGTSFAGHYILLLGYSYETDTIQYMDPARDSACCYMCPEDLDVARKVAGTDEDLIEIDLQ